MGELGLEYLNPPAACPGLHPSPVPTAQGREPAQASSAWPAAPSGPGGCDSPGQGQDGGRLLGAAWCWQGPLTLSSLGKCWLRKPGPDKQLIVSAQLTVEPGALASTPPLYFRGLGGISANPSHMLTDSQMVAMAISSWQWLLGTGEAGLDGDSTVHGWCPPQP